MLRLCCYALFLLFFQLSGLRLSADPETRALVQRYYQGVVKVLVIDPQLGKVLRVDEKEGYLCRGSGFFVTDDGLIVTNRHVVDWCVKGYLMADWVDERGKEHHCQCLTYEPGLEDDPKIKKIYFIGHGQPYIQVFHGFSDKEYQLYRAKVLLLGENYDGALLQVTTDFEGQPVDTRFVALPIGRSLNAAMGSDLVILGFPSLYAHSRLDIDLHDTLTMSFGKHSGWDYLADRDGLIKTDATIHEGNSGGPVFDDSEKVIGIATGMNAKTEIGLVEQIDQLYRLAEHDPPLLQRLVARGLIKNPKDRAVKAFSGKPQPIPKMEKKS